MASENKTNNSETGADVAAKFIHDESFLRIFEAENRSVSRFFDAVFGFFYRNNPENVFNLSQYYGKQVVSSSYDRWQKKYQDSIESPTHPVKRSRNESPIEEDKDTGKEKSGDWRTLNNPWGPTHTTNTTTVSKRSESDKKDTVLTGSKKEKRDEESKIASFDVTNGATLDNYAWNQTIDDLEIRIPVQDHIRKGHQVKVTITEQHLTVEVQTQDGKDFTTLVDGPLIKTVRLDGSVWLLSPQQYISILMEKEAETWWDRLLEVESPIDLKKINTERDFGSLPEDDRLSIERVISEQLKEDRVEEIPIPASQQNLQSVLRKAWDAEGSPFRGQPFDPSLVQVVHSS